MSATATATASHSFTPLFASASAASHAPISSPLRLRGLTANTPAHAAPARPRSRSHAAPMTMTRGERDRSRMFVRALYEYSTDDSTSLSFRAGDVIQVLKQLDSGWWDGIVNNQRGWFPSNYCILMPPGEQDDGMLSDDSDDADEDDSYDEYDDGSGSSDSERDLASPGLPMEGTNIGKTDVAGLWVPQATPHGRLFYFNLETAETRQELPLEAPTSVTETGPRDRSRSIPDQTRAPQELLARAFEREPPLYLKSDDDESASDRDGDMNGLNGAMVTFLSFRPLLPPPYVLTLCRPINASHLARPRMPPTSREASPSTLRLPPLDPN